MIRILLLILLPIFSFGQVVNTFPWVNNFENYIPLQQDPNDDGDWLFKQGSTPSFATGPNGDHTTGNGTYFYVESSGGNNPNKQFISYTPMFDISTTPGRVLSFWYHMFGATMGELEIAIIDTAGNYIFIDAYNGDQGFDWNFAYYPLDSFNVQHDFQIAFIGNTGTSYTSDICIDDIMVSDPFPIIFGCTDTISSNYDSTATLNDGSCIYVFGCTDGAAENYNPWANVDDGSCVAGVTCNPGQVLIEVSILLDNWPSETYWEITDTLGNILYSVPSETYDYTQVGQTVNTNVCIPANDSIIFTINDTYGDGIGGGSVVGSCVVTNLDCKDTIFVLSPANFGFTSSSDTYASDVCNNDTTIYGCTTPSYVEYDSLATVDDGSCLNLVTYGCTDPTAFNYDPTADVMLLTSPCTYDLILYDAGGDSWGACWLGVEQGDSLWQFKINQNGVYSDTFELVLNSNDEVYFYYFEIPTPQQNTQQLDIQTIQNSFKLENDFGVILYEGNNPWPGPNENKLRNYKSALDIYEAQPYCGTECIPVVLGCMDTLAYNYNALANTSDECYYNPGCTNPGYLQYYTQGFVAGIDDGSCVDIAVFGCTDSTAFNYDSLANVDNGGCVAVILGCMQPLAFNYNSNANIDDGSCVPFIYGCTDPIMFNFDANANTDDGSCVPYVFGCIDSTMFNYNPLANADNSSCIPYISGCTDPSMLNYNSQANTEDFSCIPYVYGCMDSLALNFDSLANTDNGSCIEVVVGCMDPNAYNYEPTANVNDSVSCLYSANCITGAGYPYWLNDPCYAWVISVDEYCCENEWDTICQATYDYCEGSWSGPLLSRLQQKSELIMITDLLGRPAKENKNKLLFYMYKDGTVKRKIIK